jgi:hypothetical protein
VISKRSQLRLFYRGLAPALLILVGLIYLVPIVYAYVEPPQKVEGGESSPLDEQTLVALRQIPALSALVTATVKVPWIDSKIKELDQIAAQYDEAYKRGIQRNMNRPTTLDANAADQISVIAKDVLHQEYDLHKHPNFDNNHYCCWDESGIEVDRAEFYSMNMDEHNTAMATIQQIRKKIQSERDRYDAIIERAAQQ